MITINETPKYEFSYCQIPNHNFRLALLSSEYQVLHTPFECKDYLQDIFWSEFTDHTATIWGITWKKGMLDMEGDSVLLGVFGGSVKLRDHAKHLQEFLNTFDSAQGFKLTEVMETTDDFSIVVKFSKEWITSGPLLSAFTSAIRVSGSYEGGDVIKFLDDMDDLRKNSKEVTPKYSLVDVYRLNKSKPRLKALLAGMKVDFSWEKIRNSSEAHNTGIVGFAGFPEVL